MSGPFADAEIYVFDIDGVLVDVTERIKAILEELGAPHDDPRRLRGPLRRRFWELFLSPRYLHLDRPREVGIEILLDRLHRGRVVLFTGRPESMRRATIEELRAIGIPVERVELLMRRPGDFRPDYVVKRELVENLEPVVEVHDDSPEVLDAIRRVKPGARLYLHHGGTYSLYHPGVPALDEYF